MDLIWFCCCLIHTCTLVLYWEYEYMFIFLLLPQNICQLIFLTYIFVYIFIIYKSHFPSNSIPSIIFYCWFFICLKLLIKYSDDCFYLILKQGLFLAKMHQWLWYFILSIQYKTVLICFIYIFVGQHILLFCDAFNFTKFHNLVITI